MLNTLSLAAVAVVDQQMAAVAVLAAFALEHLLLLLQPIRLLLVLAAQLIPMDLLHLSLVFRRLAAAKAQLILSMLALVVQAVVDAAIRLPVKA